MAAAIVIGAWVLAAALVCWLIVYVVSERDRRQWRPLPTPTGLALYIEYQCWTPMDFEPRELSQALQLAVECLSACFDRGLVRHVLSGAGILIFAAGTYPGNECNEALTVSVSGTQGPFRRIAVEESLTGLAHAIAHAVDRYQKAGDIAHTDWEARGISGACRDYAVRLGRLRRAASLD